MPPVELDPSREEWIVVVGSGEQPWQSPSLAIIALYGKKRTWGDDQPDGAGAERDASGDGRATRWRDGDMRGVWHLEGRGQVPPIKRYRAILPVLKALGRSSPQDNQLESSARWRENVGRNRPPFSTMGGTPSCQIAPKLPCHML
jgi:hypothetical protein